MFLLFPSTNLHNSVIRSESFIKSSNSRSLPDSVSPFPASQSISSSQLVPSPVISSVLSTLVICSVPLFIAQLHRPCPDSIHVMTTRSKTGIFKPKCFTVSSTSIPQELASVATALLDPHWKQAAMIEEHTALLRNGTWTLVPFSKGMHVVDNKWVFRLKYNPDGSIQRYKARLVAKGFQQTVGIDFNETFSSVIKPCTIRVILTLAASYNWDIQ